MRRPVIALSLALSFATVVPADAGPGLECGQNSGRSRVSAPPAYGELPGEVTVLPSAYDGDQIQVAVLRPAVPAGVRVPVIALASPYHFGGFDGDLHRCDRFLADNFVTQGYAVAFIPVRGTADSGTCFDLMGDAERADLDQAITWLGTRPWSSGAVGMIGLSYDGSTPWEVAGTGNPYLKTIVPISGVNDVFGLMYQHGSVETRGEGLLNALYYTYSFNDYKATSGRSPYHMATGVACPEMAKGFAAAQYAARTGERDPLGFWAARDSRARVLANYRGSVLLVQGLKDWNVDPEHTLPFAEQVATNGNEVAYVLGQWSHAYPDSPFNALHSRGDWADAVLAWFDRHLKGDDAAPAIEGAQIEDALAQWRREPTWPPPARTAQTWYLTPDGTLAGEPSTATGSRLSGGAATVGHPDPDDPRCYACEHLATFQWRGVPALHLTGQPVVDLTITPTGPAGQISAAIYESGSSLRLLGWGQVDLRFPNGGEIATPVIPGQPMRARLTFEPLDTPVRAGTDLLLVLMQKGYADHTNQHPLPVRVEVGGTASSLMLHTIVPDPDTFFRPPVFYPS